MLRKSILLASLFITWPLAQINIPCTNQVNNDEIALGYYCCMNAQGKKVCTERHISDDTIWMKPKLIGGNLSDWLLLAAEEQTKIGNMDWDLDRRDSIRAAQEIEVKRMVAVKNKWSKRVIKAVTDGSVFIGMTTMQAMLSWGKPVDINRTTTASGTSEQWIYSGGSYLYFQDGKLTTIQN